MDERSTSDPGPHFVDKHVGERLRRRRKDLHLSQEDLAASVGLTFQQIQKYERGSNRVSASKLYQMAQTLKASVAYFYEGLANPTQGVAEDAPDFIHDLPPTPEQRELVSFFERIDSRNMRKQVLNLVKAIAEETVPPGRRNPSYIGFVRSSAEPPPASEIDKGDQED